MLFGITVFYYLEDYEDLECAVTHVSGDLIEFSHASGFYDESIVLQLQIAHELPAGMEIYYSLDGDDPEKMGQVYEKPITLGAVSDEVVIYPVKACLYYKGKFSEVMEYTYVVGSQVMERYNMSIISLTCDSNSLYDESTGIFMNPRNRGDDWIRNAHITMFEPDGGLVWEQDIGINVLGGSSSEMDVKSLKIIADTIYDENNFKLKFDGYYDENDVFSKCSFVQNYNSMRLKSGAQDMYQGNIRSAVVSRLAQESSFSGCTDTHRAVVYLNGQFYGIFDVQQQYSNSYIANKFSLDTTDAIEKAKGSEKDCLKKYGLYEYFLDDLTLEENRQRLEEVVDMDEFLLYYAIEILINNTDWPQNNYQMWRYTGTYTLDNPYSDGRWRFLIYDTDITYWSSDNLMFYEGCDADTFVSLLEKSYRAYDTVFANVMNSKVYRDKFIIILCDLLNSSFTAENVVRIIDEEYGKIDKENRMQLGETSADEIQQTYITWMRQQAQEREGEIREVLLSYFDLDTMYEFSLITSEGLQVSWGNTNLYGQETYTNTYYDDVEFIVTQQAYPGYEFSHWLVNGEKIKSEVLYVSRDYIQNGSLIVEAVAEQIAEEQLVISEISANGDVDWIKLCNVGNVVVDISRYYITDDMNKLMQYQLPNLVLQPGELVTINCSNNYYAIGEYICNFNLNQYEQVFLYNADTKEIDDIMAIPRMEKDETYGRYMNSDSYVFFRNQDNQRYVSNR